MDAKRGGLTEAIIQAIDAWLKDEGNEKKKWQKKPFQKKGRICVVYGAGVDEVKTIMRKQTRHLRTTQQSTIYSDMQILFGMIYVTMSSINSMSDKLVNKKDVEAVKTELTRKVEQYLGPLKKEIDEWKQREDKAKSTGACG
jgi:uncharacterized protein YlbG (UPF0298 family)